MLVPIASGGIISGNSQHHDKDSDDHNPAKELVVTPARSPSRLHELLVRLADILDIVGQLLVQVVQLVVLLVDLLVEVNGEVVKVLRVLLDLLDLLVPLLDKLPLVVHLHDWDIVLDQIVPLARKGKLAAVEEVKKSGKLRKSEILRIIEVELLLTLQAP